MSMIGQLSRFAVIALLLTAFGCAALAEVPTVNVPPALRQSNWNSREGYGSCVHASLVTLLRWQGHEALADWWRKTYAGGENSNRLYARLNAEGVRFAQTTSGDVRFLEWACRTRRGCALGVIVTYGGRPAYHCLCLVHLTDRWAGLVDNNDTTRIVWVRRDTLIDCWQAAEGWAFTPVYTPAPPLPVRSNSDLWPRL